MAENQSLKLFVGCTLGPIFATMNKARKPLEVWMASYMFSHLAELIVAEIMKDERVTMVSPSAGGVKAAQGVKQVGLYSDHMFFEMNNGAKEADAESLVERAKEAALGSLAEDICSSCDAGKKKDDILQWLRDTVFVLTTTKLQEGDHEIPQHELTDALDLLECYPPYVDCSDDNTRDWIEEYLISLTADSRNPGGKSQWLKKQAFNQERLKALQVISKSDGTDEERLKNYFVMVQADGDNLGRLLANLSQRGQTNAIRQISTFLFERGRANAARVSGYGALPIYFGGDDMLFLAPVKGKGKNNETITIFELIRELGEDFDAAYGREHEQLLSSIEKDDVRKDIAGLLRPALSFGAMFCYRKYPLELVREEAANALFRFAKNTNWTGERGKQAVYIQLQKHSGQQSSICLRSASEEENGAYKQFVKLFGCKMPKLSLHALHWKLMEQRTIIARLLMMKEEEGRVGRLGAWLKANFNESAPEADDIKTVQDFLCAVADDFWDGTGKPLGRVEAQQRILDSIDGAFRMLEMFDEEAEPSAEEQEEENEQ